MDEHMEDLYDLLLLSTNCGTTITISCYYSPRYTSFRFSYLSMKTNMFHTFPNNYN